MTSFQHATLREMARTRVYTLRPLVCRFLMRMGFAERFLSGYRITPAGQKHLGRNP